MSPLGAWLAEDCGVDLGIGDGLAVTVLGGVEHGADEQPSAHGDE